MGNIRAISVGGTAALRRGASVIAIVAISLGLAPSARAGQLVNTKIANISIQGTQHAVIQFTTTINPKATCATSAVTMVADVGTPKGKAILSIATAAMLGNLNVLVIGGGNSSCTTPTGGVASENIATIAISSN